MHVINNVDQLFICSTVGYISFFYCAAAGTGVKITIGKMEVYMVYIEAYKLNDSYIEHILLLMSKMVSNFPT